MAVAQEVHHGHFHFGHFGPLGHLGHFGHAMEVETPTLTLAPEEVEARLAEAENASVSLTLLGGLDVMDAKPFTGFVSHGH